MVALSCVPALLCGNAAGRAVLPRAKPHCAVCHVTVRCALHRELAVPREDVGGFPVVLGSARLCVAAGWLVLQMFPCFFPLEMQALCTGVPGLLQTNVKAGPGARE